MPTEPGAAPERARLLGGTMPSDNIDDIELKNIQLQTPLAKSLTRASGAMANAREERVETEKGSVLVAVHGDKNKPSILTFHDIGLNYVSNFSAFFSFIDMKTLLHNFCVYHVNAPGQEEGAALLPEGYVYPSLDELAEMLTDVLNHFKLNHVVGLGVGSGANILARYALTHPEKVDGLVLVNCVSTQAGWIEWGYQKLNTRHLRSKGMTQGVLDYLMWHHFGKVSRVTEERNHDLVQVYKQYFEKHTNPGNLSLLINAYIQRSDLGIAREKESGSGSADKKKEVKRLKMPVLNITGSLSPHMEDTITLNSRLDPANSNWMKIQDSGMVLEEQPGRVCEALRLFLQGLGYAIKLQRKFSTTNMIINTTSTANANAKANTNENQAASVEGKSN